MMWYVRTQSELEDVIGSLRGGYVLTMAFEGLERSYVFEDDGRRLNLTDDYDDHHHFVTSGSMSCFLLDDMDISEEELMEFGLTVDAEMAA